MKTASFYRKGQTQASLDLPLLVATVLLTGIGLVMIYSASSALAEAKFGDASFFLKRQLVRVAVCFGIMFIAVHFNYKQLGRFSLPLLALTALLLVLLLIPGVSLGSGAIKGAKRWLGFGPLTFQPSDLARFALIVYVCDYLVRKERKMDSFKEGLVPMLVVCGAFLGLILLQPDFSTAATIGIILAIVMFVGRVRIRHMLILAGAAVPAAAIFIFSASYRMKRILGFMNPGADAHGIGYQTLQSLVGLGNGGLFGLGLGQSRQKMFFLPEPYTDYIFSIIGEELGFVGVVAILGLLGIVIWRGLRIALRSQDVFGFLLATGMTAAIALYSLFNIGIVVGVLPSTGLPLPFISYGGSSLIFNFVAVGVLLNISREQKKSS